MYLNLSKWFATTSSIWGNGARISRAIDRRPTDWTKNKARLIKNIAEIETIAEEFGLEVLVLEEGEMKKTLVRFLDRIREYESEAGKALSQDERDSIEFVKIYLQ